MGLRYGRRHPWVLREVSLGLGAGEVIEVTGRDGAGKSSLLRVLAGVLPASAGRVLGRPGRVGWAPERFPTAQPFEAGAYLVAQARVRGLTAGAATRAVEREAARLHLDPLLGTRLAELSKGSAQKLGIAQAMLVQPELLVLDEPWSGLDADARAVLPDLVEEVRAAHGRVVVSDHQRQAATLPIDRRWHLEAGRVTQVPVVAADGPVVVQVTLPGADAQALLSQLREQGLAPRVVDRATRR